MKTMHIDDVAYVDAPETDGCRGCAFEKRLHACNEAIIAGKVVFGAVCGKRKVIYIRAEDAKPSSAMAELLKARDAINAAIAALEAA